MTSPATRITIVLVLVVASAAGQRRVAAPTQPVIQGSADQFVEVSQQAGIQFQLTSGGPEKRYIIEAKGGGGIAWVDYDDDE